MLSLYLHGLLLIETCQRMPNPTLLPVSRVIPTARDRQMNTKKKKPPPGLNMYSHGIMVTRVCLTLQLQHAVL